MKKKFSENHLHNILRLSEHGIYKLLHEVPNELRFTILGNLEISGNCLNLIESRPSAKSSCKNKSFVNTSRKVLKNPNSTFLVVYFFT